MQPTLTTHRETHLTGLETEVDVCLFTEASGRLDALLQFSLTHTQQHEGFVYTARGKSLQTLAANLHHNHLSQQTLIFSEPQRQHKREGNEYTAITNTLN